jgi:hypothetical protein
MPMEPITTAERLSILLDVDISLTRYSDVEHNDYRASISDYCVYHTLKEMFESDMDELEPYNIWTTTPDEVMAHIIDNKKVFTIQFGWEDLWESLRDYLTENKFVVHGDDISDEEYQQLLEGNK